MAGLMAVVQLRHENSALLFLFGGILLYSLVISTSFKTT